MSTRRLNEALALMRDIQGHSTRDVHDAAATELKNIERAAIAVWVDTLSRRGDMSPEMAEAALLLQVIARESSGG